MTPRISCTNRRPSLVRSVQARFLTGSALTSFLPIDRKTRYLIISAQTRKTTMTYNFDPDKWYDDELAMLQAKRTSGVLTPTQFDDAVTQLDKRHEAMWQRLDGTYRISAEPSLSQGARQTSIPQE